MIQYTPLKKIAINTKYESHYLININTMTREGENLKKDILSLMTPRLYKLFGGKERCTIFCWYKKLHFFDVLLRIHFLRFVL